jgi:hypothetical protein
MVYVWFEVFMALKMHIVVLSHYTVHSGKCLHYWLFSG